MPEAEWDLPRPHVLTLEVVASDIDAYNHVNNSVARARTDYVCISLNSGRAVWIRAAPAACPNPLREATLQPRAAAPEQVDDRQ
jgi:hypothetical protein